MENKMTEKFMPKIGDKLYLSQKTGNYYVDMVKKPYTVIDVKASKVIIQSAKCIFNGPRYYDSLPDNIVEDTTGTTKALHWSAKLGAWQTGGSYPEIAFFGEYKYFPYLN